MIIITEALIMLLKVSETSRKSILCVLASDKRGDSDRTTVYLYASPAESLQSRCSADREPSPTAVQVL